MTSKSSRNQSLRLVIEALESRITPSLSPTGSLEDLAKLSEGRYESFTLYESPPESRIGSEPGLELNAFTPFTINFDDLTPHLADAPLEFESGNPTILALPRPDGNFDRFNVWEVSIMEPELAARYSNIHTWRGQGIDDPTATLSADLTPHGFHAQIMSPDGRWYVDPYYHLDSNVYASYFARDLVNNHGPLGEDDLLDDLDPPPPAEGDDFGARPSNGQTLRTYRTAVAATGEYTAFHGGTVNLGQAAIVTAMNRVSGIYETELSIRLVLVANNNSIVYTNAATDPYTNSNPSALLSQNQSNLDSVIGNANYDLGHVFSTAGGGLAGLGVVGKTGQKALGETGTPSPNGDPFYVDYVAHEMGHQFGADHTFNGVNGSASGNRNASTAYEPGSGSTIMAYAGICGPDDLQNNSDAYFHAASLDEITNYTFSGPGAGTPTSTGNSIPTAEAGPTFTIPARTPFALTGTATDADAGDVLTYNWEQYDLGPAVALSAADNGSSPLFRSLDATTSPTRNFPKLSTILSGGSNNSEKLPTVSQTMTFRLTVRDNRAIGAYNRDDVNLTVFNTGVAFAVTSPNSFVSYSGGSTQTVTWNVAGTNAAPINASQVNILLSTDGGQTFSTVLASAAANDGSHVVTMPNISTTQARIKVEPVNNIFFDIGNANFTIVAVPETTNVTSSLANGTYSAGQVIPITISFTAAVNVTGSPELALNSGGVATYFGGSGTPVLTFNYTVGATDLTSDLDYLSSSALDLNGGTIKAQSTGRDALLALPAPGAAGSLGANKDIVISTIEVPDVVNVTSPIVDDTYGLGAVIPITIEFDRVVVVSGNPTLSVDANGSALAVFAGGSNSTTLTFSYIVVSGDATADLNYTSINALSLNGGTIIDQANSNNAVLTLPDPAAAGSLGTNKNIAIVTPTTPFVTAVDSPTADGSYGTGATVSVTVQFDQAVLVTGTPRLALNSGGAAFASYSSGDGTDTLTFVYTVANGDSSADLDYSSTSALSLEGGTIQDLTGVEDASLTLPTPGAAGSLGANKDLVIDTSLISLVGTSFTVDEDTQVGDFSIVVRRTGGSFGAVSVDYAVTNGTASSADYTVTSSANALSWGMGDSADKTIDILITPDQLSEGIETINVDLSNLIGSASLGLSSALLTILQSDGRDPGKFAYADGDVATVSLAPKIGAGSLLVYLTDDVAPISMIELKETNPLKTRVSVKVKKAKTSTDLGTIEIGTVIGTGVRSLNLPRVKLTGEGIHLSSPVQLVRLDSISNGADIEISGTIPKKSTSILVKNAIEDGTEVVLDATLRRLRATSYGTGLIQVPSIGSMRIKGNMSADILVSGAGLDPVKGKAIKSIRVGGAVDDVDIMVGSSTGTNFSGNVGSVVVGSFVNSRLFANFVGNDDGTPANGFNTASPATISRFRTTLKTSFAFRNSSVIASTIKNVTLSGVDFGNGGEEFGIFADELFKAVTIKLPFKQVYRNNIGGGTDDFSVELV